MREQQKLLLLEAALDACSDAIIITTANLEEPGPRIIYVNNAFSKMTGYKPEEVLGRTPRILQGEETDLNLMKKLKEDLKEGKEFFGRTINYRKDGSRFNLEWRIAPVRLDSHRVTHFIAIERDITERIKKQVKLMKQASVDATTNAFNRFETDRRLRQLCEESFDEDNEHCVILCDLDNFKYVNDSFGHLVGDEVLKTLAKLIVEELGEKNFLGRWGGDEFAVVLPNTNLSHGTVIAESLIAAINQNEFLNSVNVTCSMGLACHSAAESVNSLLSRADQKLYEAKADGGNCVRS